MKWLDKELTFTDILIVGGVSKQHFYLHDYVYLLTLIENLPSHLQSSSTTTIPLPRKEVPDRVTD